MQFADRIALVTGAGSGIGRAVSLMLAAEGAIVVLVGRDRARLEAVAAECAGTGGEAVVSPADVTQRGAIEAVVDGIGARWGRLDLAVNNAGGHGDFKPLHETPADECEWVFDLNLKAVFYGMRAEVSLMLRQGHGAIVNMASIFGIKGVAGIAHYVAAKHAVVGMTRAAALDYARTGIRINAVSPGATETPNLLRVTGGDAHALDAMIPVGRVGQPEDVARTVRWLLSDDARYVTGTNVSVDGGMNAG